LLIQKQQENKNNTLDSSNNEYNQIIYDLFNQISNNEKFIKSYNALVNKIQSGYRVTDDSEISTKLITLLEVNNIIIPNGSGVYTFSEDGKKLTKLLLKESIL
jgi:hypothetical protein